jgi:small subunit ribosomal protein S16
MITIRLTRVGKKKQPTYRLVIQDKLRDPWGKAIDIVGHYDPRTKPKTIVLKEEAIKAWLAKGAQPSATVRNLLIDAKIMAGEKVRSSTSNKPKPKKK